MANGVATDCVVLIPGFLGFREIGEFPYFSERAVELLRDSLNRHAQPGRIYDVRVVNVEPTSSLQSRQENLVASIAELGEARLHLVGHSTGGVDARLLLAAKPLGNRASGKRASSGESNSGLNERRFRKVQARIRGVIGIAAPHHGTWLVADPFIAMLANRYTTVPGLAGLIAEGALIPILRAVHGDASGWALVAGFFTDQKVAAQFVGNIFHSRKLLRDLHPRRMAKLISEQESEGFHVRSVVTIAGRAQPPARPRFFTPGSRWFARSASIVANRVAASAHSATALVQHTLFDAWGERLYSWLVSKTENKRAFHSVGQAKRLENLNFLRDMLNGHPRSVAVVASDGARPRELDLYTSDAVVNTVHQIVRADSEELLAVVVADHVDVLGHFGPAAGFIKSGSGFGDDQLRELYEIVAKDICDVPP